jgi:hypothetical protein
MKKIFLFGLLAMMMMGSCSKNDKDSEGGEDDPGKIIPEIPFDQLPASSVNLTVDGNARYVNVMGTHRKPLPEFARLQPKADKVRGYVKDTYGRPVKNASIGVRSSVVGGVSTPAYGVTNDKGYYEFEVPFGVAEFYNTGVAVDFEGNRAALGLYPADGELTTWSGSSGAVENFVLLPYGQGDPAELATDAWIPNNYFGGNMTLGWEIWDATYSPDGLPMGSKFTIKLTPLSLFHAAEKKTFIIEKTIGTMHQSLEIVNLPLGKYKVEVDAPSGDPYLVETLFNPREGQYGLTPKTGTRQTPSYIHVTIPRTGDGKEVLPFRSDWQEVAVDVKKYSS